MATSDFPVFLETSLGTRIIVGVNSDDTGESLKRKIVANHTDTFPDIGDIFVKAVKIRRQGKMYHLSDLMPICTLRNGMSEPLFLYAEAVTETQGINVIDGRVDEELNVPVGGRVEDLIKNEVPHTDLADPLHAPAIELRKTEKKKRRKLYAEGTSGRLTESRKSEDEQFEGGLAHEKSGCKTSNVQASNLANSNLVSFHGEKKCANDGQIKQKESREEQTRVEDGDKSDKRRMIAKVQQPVNDIRLEIGEPDNTKESAHEVGLFEVKDLSGKSLGQDFVSPQIPDNTNLLEPKFSSLVENNTPTEKLTVNTIDPYLNEKADESECNDFHDRPDNNQISGIAELLKNAIKDDTKNVQPLQEVTQTTNTVLIDVPQEKKKRKKAKAFPSNVPFEVQPIRDDQPPIEDNIQISMEKDFQAPEKPGAAIEMPNSISSQCFKSREEPEGNSRADKDTRLDDDQIPVPNDIEERGLEEASKNVLKESTHVVDGDSRVVFGEKKRRKKTKAAITEFSTKEPSSRENGSFKEKESNSVLDKEMSKVRADDILDNTAEAVKDKSKRKRKKTTSSSIVLSLGEDDSEKTENKVHKNNQIIEKQRDSEVQQKSGAAIEMPNSISSQLFRSREEPEGNSRAEKDIISMYQPQKYQISVPNDMEECRLDDASKNVLKESTHAVDGDPGVVFGERKKRKKTKTAIAELTKELLSRENESCKEEESKSVLEKEISEFGADDILDNTAEAVKDKSKKKHKKTAASSNILPLGEDDSEKADEVHKNNQIIEKQRDSEIQKKSGEGHEVALREKRKRKKNQVISADVMPQELSALQNDVPKEGESNFKLEKEECNEPDSAHLPKLADDVAFLAPKFTDPDDSINNASGILTDLKRRSSLQPDAQIDVVPQMQLLANVAVDHHEGEVYHGPVETKKKRKSGKKSTNNTETSQNTRNALTGESVIALDEKQKHITEKTFSPSIRDIGIETRDSFDLAISQSDCARGQKLDSNMVDKSVGDGKKRKRKKQEATNSGAQATSEGTLGEVNGSIKNLVSQIDASGNHELQIKIQKSLKKESIPSDMSFGDGKSYKGKSKEKGVTGKLGDASLADGTIQDAPNTPENVQKLAESYNKDASIEAAQTKSPEVLQAPTTEKVNFIDYFLHEGANQPDDTTSASLKETKGSKTIENKSFSRDGVSASVDTVVSAKTKKADGKVQIMKKNSKSSKEHIPNGTSNDKSRVHTSMDDDGGLKKDNNMKSLVADMMVMSDVSTEDEKEAKSQPRYMVAVRKVASKAVGKKMDASRKTSPVFSSSSLPGDMRSDASTGDESGSVNRGSPMGSPMSGKEKGMMSPSSDWKDVQLADDDMPMSQEPARPRKKVDLTSILRSSSSYKKAKVSLSQSQAEDHDMIAVVFETQQD